MGSSRNLLSAQVDTDHPRQLVTTVEPLRPWRILRHHGDMGNSCQHCLTQGEKGRGTATTAVPTGEQREMREGTRLWEIESSTEPQGWTETPLRAIVETVVASTA